MLSLTLALLLAFIFTTTANSSYTKNVEKVSPSEWNDQPLCDAGKHSNNLHDLKKDAMKLWFGEPCYGGCIQKCYGLTMAPNIKEDDVQNACGNIGNSVYYNDVDYNDKYMIKKWKRDESCTFTKNCGGGMKKHAGYRAVCKGTLYDENELPPKDVILPQCDGHGDRNQAPTRCQMKWVSFPEAKEQNQKCPIKWYKDNDVWYVKGLSVTVYSEEIRKLREICSQTDHDHDCKKGQHKIIESTKPFYMQICTKNDNNDDDDVDVMKPSSKHKVLRLLNYV